MRQHYPLFSCRYASKSKLWSSRCTNGDGTRLPRPLQQIHEIQSQKSSLVEQGPFCPLVPIPRLVRLMGSNGHACCLQYILLHLFGYGLGMDQLQRFRQLGSLTPGHPEANHGTPGIEVTTGPLGQGLNYLWRWSNDRLRECCWNGYCTSSYCCCLQ